jgi:DNA-binding MarR family transcriptional regulator
MSKISRNELIQQFITAIRASQTANQMLDHALAEYMGIDDAAFRCLDILDQEGPMSAGELAERARLSPGAMTALLDRLEAKGYAARSRDTQDRRRVLVEVSPELRQRGEELYGTPEEGAEELSGYSDEELEFLIRFLHGSVEYQEERMRRLDAIKTREADE